MQARSRKPGKRSSGMPGEPATMTDRELRDAIERTLPKTKDWNALVRAAYWRRTFPLSWLPVGVVWSYRTDYGTRGKP